MTYTCNTGYEITTGDAVRECQLSEQWSGARPTCSSMDNFISYHFYFSFYSFLNIHKDQYYSILKILTGDNYVELIYFACKMKESIIIWLNGSTVEMTLTTKLQVLNATDKHDILTARLI